VEIAFYKTDQTILSWWVDFDVLEYSIEQGYSSRAWPGYLTLELDNGDRLRAMDFRPYVDGRPFETVMATLYADSLNEDAFIYEVWNIVAQLSGYSSDIGETPRYPLETFLAGGGDCEDTSILFASMILAAPVDWKVSLVYVDIYHPTAPETFNHVIVNIETGSASYYVETTSDSVMQPYTEGVRGWTFEVSR